MFNASAVRYGTSASVAEYSGAACRYKGGTGVGGRVHGGYYRGGYQGTWVGGCTCT